MTGKNPNFKAPSYGCAGYRVDNGPGGYDYGCAYNTSLICEDCKYNDPPGRKDPQAKANQLKRD